MMTVAEFLGDGDGPATDGQPESTRGPLLIMARPVTTNWRVGREGEIVTMRIGNGTLRLRYPDAMRLGHALMAKATEAKALAGDTGKRIEVR